MLQMEGQKHFLAHIKKSMFIILLDILNNRYDFVNFTLWYYRELRITQSK